MKGKTINYFWLVSASIFVTTTTLQYVNAETAVLIGGQTEGFLNPATDEVETFGPCGLFNASLPNLPNALRNHAAAQLGDDIVVCGGYRVLLGGRKDCYALSLAEGVEPREWRDFPPLNKGRYDHAMVSVGGALYAVGGSTISGAVHSIERYNAEQGAWEEVGQTYGIRLDFCSLAWGNDGILLIGGYDDMGGEQHVELFNTTTLTWSKLANLNTPRGLLACTVDGDGIVAAGGWTPNYNDPDFPTQEPTKTDERYNSTTDTWEDMPPMRHRRTAFGLTVINGVLTAFGGYEGYYVDTIEYFHEGTDSTPGGWSFHTDSLQQKKSSFGFVRISDILEDPNC